MHVRHTCCNQHKNEQNDGTKAQAIIYLVYSVRCGTRRRSKNLKLLYHHCFCKKKTSTHVNSDFDQIGTLGNKKGGKKRAKSRYGISADNEALFMLNYITVLAMTQYVT